jgi:hypothetical protein
MQPFLALITPLEPSHPIAPGGQPPVGIWPSPRPPYVDAGFPGPQPGAGRPTQPIYHPPQVTHPIVIPPGSMGDGKPTHPIVIPPPPLHPSHPIVLPPNSIGPGFPAHPIMLPGIDNTLPGAQPGIDNTLPGAQPVPSHPIVLPPVPPVDATDKALVLVVTPGGEPVWFVIDKDDGLKPTHPQPKSPFQPKV